MVLEQFYNITVLLFNKSTWECPSFIMWKFRHNKSWMQQIKIRLGETNVFRDTRDKRKSGVTGRKVWFDTVSDWQKSENGSDIGDNSMILYVWYSCQSPANHIHSLILLTLAFSTFCSLTCIYLNKKQLEFPTEGSIKYIYLSNCTSLQIYNNFICVAQIHRAHLSQWTL